MNENNNQIKNDRLKNLKTKGIAAILSATTFLGGLGIGIGATQAKANETLREYENLNKKEAYSIGLEQIEKIEDLQNSLDSVNEQVSILQDYVDQLKKTNAEAAKTIQEQLDTIKALGTVVNSTNDSSATWIKYAQEYKAQVDALTAELKYQHKNNEELNTEIADLKNQVSTHKKSEDALQYQITKLQEEIDGLRDKIIAQNQKPVDPTAPTIEGFKASFNKVFEEENKNGNSAAIESQIKRLTSEVELAYFQGILPYDEVLALLQDVKLIIDPYFNENDNFHGYLAESIDDRQFIIFSDHLNRSATKLDNGNNGLSVEMTLNNEKIGQYYAGQYNGEKSLFMSQMGETYFLHKDKSNSVQGSYNGEYFTSNISQNQNTGETEKVTDAVIKSLINTNILSFTGEGSEFMYGDDNRDFTILEDGSYQIDGRAPQGSGDDEYTLEYLTKYTPNAHGGFDCEAQLSDGIDSGTRTAIWGTITAEEYNQIKNEVLKKVEAANSNYASFDK